jgi:hypothetical protein
MLPDPTTYWKLARCRIARARPAGFAASSEGCAIEEKQARSAHRVALLLRSPHAHLADGNAFPGLRGEEGSAMRRRLHTQISYFHAIQQTPTNAEATVLAALVGRSQRSSCSSLGLRPPQDVHDERDAMLLIARRRRVLSLPESAPIRAEGQRCCVARSSRLPSRAAVAP